ncbi:hypothetical protein CANCADRAFT_57589 [Tortispora caseinolytica NRRL Y-17796]|uniref:Dihydroorotate dehydrogenase (quinone), mitochondrial n=1 Tax=Tortispora caseinolytica NRRL Y-17796 TaxID=767744 RepID=A0A1E4THX2_9ASCO|nr:hypothetical protein CANCADRAFT_57589 [Tortispora caseinolytica NRRL Y-17796]
MLKQSRAGLRRFNGTFRHISATRKKSTYRRPIVPLRFRNGVIGALAVGGIVTFSVYYTYADAAFHRFVSSPLVRLLLDAECAHRFAIEALKYRITPWEHSAPPPNLEVKVFNSTLDSPVGLAAGFDKNGEAIDGLFDLGFSYVEIGSVTPEPQPGNPKPRVFRLPEDRAVINRYGFNSDGAVKVLVRLRQRLYGYYRTHSGIMPRNNSLRSNRLLAVNLGKNKTSTDEAADYVRGLLTLGPYADVVVINISSPNTPGLRDLQNESRLKALLDQVLEARSQLPFRIPLCVKIAPDLSIPEVESIAHVLRSAKVDGVIVANTTVARPATLRSEPDLKAETGGLSGPPLKEKTLSVLRVLRKNIGNDITIIGCGGISSGKDAIAYAKAGATFVQLYTSMIYGGAGTALKIRDEIAAELNGRKWMDIIGTE